MHKLRTAIGTGLAMLAHLQLAILGLAFIGLVLRILAADFGLWAGFVGLLLFPIAVIATPFYAILVHGDWTLLVAPIAIIAVYWILFLLGGLILPDEG